MFLPNIVLLDINCLPDEILEEIFQFVWDSDGDAAFAVLSLVCRRWQILVTDEIFRRRVHFRWLATVHDWSAASKEFKEQYVVMYDISECLGCNTKYKDGPGYMRCGKAGKSLRFYSEADDNGHPGYCSPYCASMFGTYTHPLGDWETE